MSSLTISSLTDRLNNYYTRVTASRAGSLSLVFLAFWAARYLLKRRERIAAKKAWSNLSAEVAVVTGGSGGIGIEVVKRLSARGVKVAILDIVEPERSVLSSRVKYYRTDLTDYDNILDVSKKIEKELGPVSILINNAGVANDGASIIEFEPKKTKLTIEVNLLSHFYTLKIFLPHMIRTNHGHVMATASAGSFIMPAGGADYGSTKAGVLSLHETLQIELEVLYQKRTGVKCSIVHPYWIRTPMTEVIFKDKMLKKMIQPTYVADKMVEQIINGQGGSLYLPKWIGYLSFLRTLPHSLQHRIRVGATLDLRDSKREERADPVMP